MSTLQQLIDRLRPTLNDAAKDRHSDAKLLEYAVDGLRERRVLRPDLFTVNTAWPARAGCAAIPAATVLLIDVFGTTGGDEITVRRFRHVHRVQPGWRKSVRGPAEIWMRLPATPRKQPNSEFYVWPPQVGGRARLSSAGGLHRAC
jgi:hypothetical protein